MAQIQLTQGQVALVDDADFDWLSLHKWRAICPKNTDSFYAVRTSSRKDGKHHEISMSRLILGLERGDLRQGDHQNHNTLNNRRDNLRICTRSENQRNQKPQKNTTSKFKGVSWNKVCKKWQASILINGKAKHLGFWNMEEVAALRYDMVAIREFGEFAYLNF